MPISKPLTAPLVRMPRAPRSSFGEYNPGGGKEQVRKYLLLCKEQVEKSQESLTTIIKLLKL